MHTRTNRQTDGQMDGRTHDGHNAMTIARWPLASGTKNIIEIGEMLEIQENINNK